MRRGLGKRQTAAAMPRDLPAGTKIVLHVGSGPDDGRRLNERFKTSAWHELRLDINPAMKPDILASMVDMPIVPDASVDAVWSSHNLEHVFAYEAPLVLGEFLRVLRPGGFALLTMPDMQGVAERIARGGRLEDPIYRAPGGDPITALDVVYGHGAMIAAGNEFMAHRTGYTVRTLTQRLREAGFCDIKMTRESGDVALWAEARRPV